MILPANIMAMFIPSLHINSQAFLSDRLNHCLCYMRIYTQQRFTGHISGEERAHSAWYTRTNGKGAISVTFFHKMQLSHFNYFCDSLPNHWPPTTSKILNHQIYHQCVQASQAWESVLAKRGNFKSTLETPSLVSRHSTHEELWLPLASENW